MTTASTPKSTRNPDRGLGRREMPPGTRVRLYRSPWPARAGLTATVVAPPADGTYPQPAPYEVVILIDNDPLTATRTDRTWSCVIGRRNLHLL